MGTPVPSIAAQSLSGRGEGGGGTSFLAAMSRARSRPAAATRAPLAPAARSARLAVSRTPASSSSRPAALANVTAAPAMSFIAANPGDILPRRRRARSSAAAPAADLVQRPPAEVTGLPPGVRDIFVPDAVFRAAGLLAAQRGDGVILAVRLLAWPDGPAK
jgi:hypothetical protein